MVKSLVLGISASFFFAFTFILNKQMNFSGGSWLWSSSLRYIFMLPILFIIMSIKNELSDVLKDILNNPIPWLLWSTVGFGLFYAPLCFVSSYGPSWLVASSWQITIIAGSLMSPLFFKIVEVENEVYKVRNKIPKKSLLLSTLILFGIFLIQYQQAKNSTQINTILYTSPVILAAFAYPLGNRKMIEHCGNKLSTFQRVFGMTLCSMPFWIILSAFGMTFTGIPSKNQIIQSLIVAIFSGIIATILFFKATNLVSHDIRKLSVVESTQCGEVLFTIIGSVFLFHDTLPTLIGAIGIAFVIVGMTLNSIIGV